MLVKESVFNFATSENLLSIVKESSGAVEFVGSDVHQGRAFMILRTVLDAAVYKRDAEKEDLDLVGVKAYLDLSNLTKLAKSETVRAGGFHAPLNNVLLNLPTVTLDMIKTEDYSEKAKEFYNHYKDYLLDVLSGLSPDASDVIKKQS
jgi:hypothetical protein